MERRSVLKVIGRSATGGIIVAIAGCGSSSLAGTSGNVCEQDPEAEGCGNNTAGTAFNLQYTSSTSDGHTHRFDLPVEDFIEPTGSKTYTSASSDGHTHQISLTAGQRADIAEGTAVLVESTEADSHTHDVELEVADDLEETTTVSTAHTHTFTIPGSHFTSDLGNVDYVSSNNSGHTHRITLSAADRAAILAGGAVEKTTTSSGGHTHDAGFEY